MAAVGTGASDQAILVALSVRKQEFLRDAALALTTLGGWHVLVAATIFTGAVLTIRSRFASALLLLFITLTARLLVELQKWVFERARPHEEFRLLDISSYAFPSGHAANSMITYLMLAYLLPRPGEWRRAAMASAVILSILIGMTRVSLGVHWPSDVVAGWSFGLLWFVLAIRLLEPDSAGFR